MAFKMKGHTLPGINQRMDKSSLPDGRAKSSAFQVAGAFITDIDELTGEKTEKRATYKETRDAERKGKKVKYTNREEEIRSREDSRNQLKGINPDGSKRGDTKESAEKLAKATEESLAQRKNWVKENKSDDASKKTRKLDKAAQQKIEIEAENKQYASGEKNKAAKRNYKPLTREQKGLLRDNETSIRENKPDLSKSAKDKDSGISSERN
jgi:hypothetical protein|tara:strand:- start:18 stop:647 length:630 start_codon:yes stop_codon:yes gene_type:complete